MRKYDKKNKRNIAIIIVIATLIIIMFSLVIRLFLATDKNEYTVFSNSIVFDKDKSIVKIEKDGIIKQKWNKEYYLIYNDENIELGDTAISYNQDNGSLYLYGKYYEIGSGDEINITSGETIIKSTALTKFYKLSDRKYLVIDKEIKSNDGLLSTSDFLMVDLDKVGNATLTNHKVNLKTFAETTIVTSNYTFDIANEILTYGSDKIDLKKIIGSSNTFTKDDLVPTEETGNGSGTETGTSNDDTTKSEEKNDTNKEKTLVETAKRESKQTSIVSISSTINKIIVDYVIYDPYNEYSSVYIEFSKDDNSSSYVDKVYLKKDATTYEFTNGIIPNTEYKLDFYYSYTDDSNNTITKKEEYKITTKKPDINISVSRIASNNIYYSIEKEYGCNFTSAKLSLVNDDNNELYSEIIDISGTMPSGNISLNGLKINENDTIKLILTDIKVDNTIVNDLQASTKIRY